MSDQDKSREQLIAELVQLRKRTSADAPLLKGEIQFSNLAESATDAIVLVNDAGNIVFWNSAAGAIFGYDKDEAINMPLNNIVGSYETHKQAFANFQLANKTSLTKKVIESNGMRKNGQLFPVEVAISFWKSDEGGLYGAIIRDISQRKHTEELLQRSEQQYRSVVETSSDAIITADMQNKIVSWNKGAERIFGYTVEEILHKTVFALVPERFHATHAKKIAELSSYISNTPMYAQYPSWGLRKNGTEFLAEASVAKWETDDGIFMTITLRDVTKRVQTEQQLRKSEEQYRSLVQTASDAIICTDLQGTIITWNKGAEEIYGYSADEIINKSFSNLLPGHFSNDTQKQILDYFAQHANGIIYRNAAIPAKHKDGREFQAEGSVSKWESSDGILLTAIVRDVTDRKEAEEALHKSEEQYRSVVETAFDAIITVDSHGIILNWNKAAELILGYSADEIINKSFITLIPERFHASQLEKLQYYDDNADIVRHGELPVKCKDGREILAESSLSKWKTKDGFYFTAFIRDITKRKLAEDALKKSEERYRVTADTVPIHLGATDQTYKYSLWNKYSEKMFGYTQDEALHKLNPVDIHETAEDAQLVVDTAMNTGFFDREVRFRRKDGSLFPAHLIVVPDKDSAGNVKGLYGFAEDITARKKGEEIVSSIDNCLLNLTSDPDSNIQYIVTSAGKILGGDCAAYHCIRGSCVHIKAEWNVPAEHKTMYSLRGNPFSHLLSQRGDGPFIINNHEEMSRFSHDSLALHLPYKTLLAIPVKTGKHINGSLHIAYCQQVTFTSAELNSFSILAKAIGNEEVRKKALLQLNKRQKQLFRSEKSLKKFSAKVLSIREEEKKSISSALHDEIGSMAIALNAPITLAKDEIIENNNDQALQYIIQTESALKLTIKRLKTIVHDLRPPDLDILGLSSSLKNHLLFLSTQSKIAIDFSTTVQDRLIRGEKAIILYRVCQEAVNNALSHAMPHKISVQLTSSNKNINLAIQDDGCGFDYKKQSTLHRKSSQLGIIGMRERIEALGGVFTIESGINKGTSVLVSIPQR